MKRVILSTLFLILIISSVLFYDKYFKKLDETENLVTENLIINNPAKSPIKSIDKKKVIL